MCWDADRTFTTEAQIDPVGELDLAHPAIVRGGSAGSVPAKLRSSQRYLTDSRVFPEKDFATPLKGFRIVREILPASPN
jgi:hypothetical protein